MRIYNTLSRAKEGIVSREPGRVTMYTCGPTVYRNIHIGNLRTFTMADWLRRALAYHGLEVIQVKNITDVGHMRQEALDRGEDKIIAQARQEGRTSADIAAFYSAAFHEDERKLNILPASVFPRATEHIPEMIAIVQGLLQRGVAYAIEGNVFFDVTRFPTYGRLSGNRLEESLELMRGEMAHLKRHPEDFPLWKRAEPNRELAWESPWGRGYPGWHIECSAMSMHYLGPQIDIHTGGVDNIFPHHEDEIAQSEAYTGERFVRYWVHAQHLLSDGLKMAKSTGNAYTLAEVEARGYAPLALRYFYTTAHYRSRINFTFGALTAGQSGLRRLRGAVIALAAHDDEARSDDDAAVTQWRSRFLSAIDDDLNLPRALSVLWEIVRPEAERAASARARLALALDLDNILGFGLSDDMAAARSLGEAAAWRDEAALARPAPPEIVTLRDERAQARARGDYARADYMRSLLRSQGWEPRDRRDGTLVLPRRAEDEFVTISRSSEASEHRGEPDRYRVSINLLARNSRADLQRCIASILRHGGGPDLELVIVDNGSTDDTLEYLRALAREGLPGARDGAAPGLQVIFADHDMGFAAGRNATLRASQGCVVVLLDTSIELRGDIWPLILTVLDDPGIGAVGPYGLVTQDLREFYEAPAPHEQTGAGAITAGPASAGAAAEGDAPAVNAIDGAATNSDTAGAASDVDAVEGYLLAFRRALLQETGLLDERFRFYRLLDIHFSFFVKAAGYRVMMLPEVGALLEKHPHREWYSLSEEERATRSKKNYDLFRDRWHHGESLLVANYDPASHWPWHDHPRHVDGEHTHAPAEVPPPGTPHRHMHRHWPDHSHDHEHTHERVLTAPQS